MSDSSDTWSESADSYFSESSSSCQCPAPRQLMRRMLDQLRRLNCRRNREEDEAEETMSMINQDPIMTHQQMARMLRERLEQLNAENDEDNQPIVRSPRQVMFVDDMPSCSGLRASPPIMAEEIMEVNVVLCSEATASEAAPSTSAEAAFGGFMEDDLGKIILDGQTILHVNFPEELDALIAKRSIEGRAYKGRSAQGTGKNKKRKAHATNGEVKVHDNGRVTIAFGGNVYEMTKSGSPAFGQELIHVDQDEGTQSGMMTSLGPVQHYVDDLPVVDEGNTDHLQFMDEEQSKGENEHGEEKGGSHCEAF